MSPGYAPCPKHDTGRRCEHRESGLEFICGTKPCGYEVGIIAQARLEDNGLYVEYALPVHVAMDLEKSDRHFYIRLICTKCGVKENFKMYDRDFRKMSVPQCLSCESFEVRYEEVVGI